MSIEQTDIVDIISTDGSTGSVVLTINDPLDWSHRAAHEALLQRKLHHYLTFVATGELLLVYPTAMGKLVVTRVVFRFPTDETARQFLTALKAMLAPVDLTLRPLTIGAEKFANADRLPGRSVSNRLSGEFCELCTTSAARDMVTMFRYDMDGHQALNEAAGLSIGDDIPN